MPVLEPRPMSAIDDMTSEQNLQIVYTQVEASTKYYSAIDNDFTDVDSPTELDVSGYLKYNARSGYINVYGIGDIDVNISTDGVTYGSDITLFNGDKFHVDGILISKIKLTHTGTDSAYRVVLV